MVASIKQKLSGHSVIGLDSSIFIYHLEANPTYFPLSQTIFNYIESGQSSSIISTITLMELTVHPWRIQRGDIARKYEALLVNFPNMKMIDITREVARKAAQLRASHNLRPADALLIAGAMANAATLWLSNDKKLQRLEAEIEVLILDDYIDKP